MSKKWTSAPGRPPIGGPGRLPGQEELLLDLARSLRQHRKGRRAIHLHFSRLGRPNLSAHVLRLAVEQLGPLVRKHEGRLFRLFNHDMVLVVKDLSFAALDEAVLRIRGIFRDNPDYRLLDNGIRSPTGSDAFCSFYDIECDADAFFMTAQSLSDAHQQVRNQPENAGDEPAPSGVIPFAHQVNPRSTTGRDNNPPGNADLIARHSIYMPVMALSRDGLATSILSEVHVRTESLKVEVRIGQNLNRPLSTTRWLLRVLGELLDEEAINRLLISRPLPTTFTLPLDISSSESSEFQDFATSYRRLSRNSVVFEFASAEVLQNPALFFNTRDRILDLGHKLCITGWDPHLFALMNATELEVHFHKISWTPLLINGFCRELSDFLRENVRRTGATKVILGDCTSAEAVAFGQRHGLLLFQGPHLDTVPRG